MENIFTVFYKAISIIEFSWGLWFVTFSLPSPLNMCRRWAHWGREWDEIELKNSNRILKMCCVCWLLAVESWNSSALDKRAQKLSMIRSSKHSHQFIDICSPFLVDGWRNRYVRFSLPSDILLFCTDLFCCQFKRKSENGKFSCCSISCSRISHRFFEDLKTLIFLFFVYSSSSCVFSSSRLREKFLK